MPTPRARSRRSDREQPRHLVGRQAGGRLVEHQQPASAASARAMATSDFSVRVRSMNPQVAGRCRRRRAPGRARRACATAPQSIRPQRRGKPVHQRDVLGTVIHSIRPRSWWMKAMPAGGAMRRIERRRRSSDHRPPSGAWTPASILISVDLPAPFSPSSATISPAPTSKRHVVERPGAAEGLGDPVEHETGGGNRRHP